MSPIKSIIILVFSIITIKGYSQYTDVINSNRPGVSRSAFSVGTNVVQFEVGPYIINEERTPEVSYEVSGFGADFAARYGLLFEELELNLEGTFQSDTKTFTSTTLSSEDKRTNLKSLTLGAKYLLFDPYKDEEKNRPDLYSWKANHSFRWRSLIPAVSVYAGANFDTNNNPYTAADIGGISPKLMVATQNNFPGGWVLVLNLIKDRIGTSQSDFQYIATLTHSFNPQWVIFGEMQGIKSDFYADNLFRLGGAYLWSKNFQLDTAITFNTKDTPAVFGVSLGMSYRLDFHEDKIVKDKNIDNGTSIEDEAKRQKNRNKGKKGDEDEEEPIIKQRKENVDFDTGAVPTPREKSPEISAKEEKIRQKNLKKSEKKAKKALKKKEKELDDAEDRDIE